MEQGLKKIEKLIGADNIKVFFEKFKAALASTPKENDKREIKIEVKGSEQEIDGITTELFTVDKTNYSTFIQEEKDYMKNGVTVISFSARVKDPAKAPVLEELYSQFAPMLTQLPFISDYGDKISFNMRVEGDKISFDGVVNDESTLEKWKEYGFDFSEYSNFKSAVKTAFKPADFFNFNLEEIAIKLLTIFIGWNTKAENIKYLISCVISALESITLAEEDKQKKVRKAISTLHLILAFLNLQFLFQYNPSEIYAGYLKRQLEKMEITDEKLTEMKDVAISMGNEMGVSMIESFGMLEACKNVSIDEITISLLCPLNKTGFAFRLLIPGITDLINEKFLNK